MISHKYPSSQKLLAEHLLHSRLCAEHCGYTKCKVKALSSKAAEVQGKGARPSAITAKPESYATKCGRERDRKASEALVRGLKGPGAAGSDPPGDIAPDSAGLESRVGNRSKGKVC